MLARGLDVGDSCLLKKKKHVQRLKEQDNTTELHNCMKSFHEEAKPYIIKSMYTQKMRRTGQFISYRLKKKVTSYRLRFLLTKM